jgi:electron transport complex protein RnfG
MREMIKMVIVLTVLSSFSGGLLAAIRISTKDQIEKQQLQFVKGPAIHSVLSAAENDPIADRFTIQEGDSEIAMFVGVVGGSPRAVAFESYGKGFGGDVGLMVAIDTAENKILGVSVTTHSETPGMGALAKDDPTFSLQFSGLSIDKPIKVTGDGGQINAISGATITSRAVCEASSEALAKYQQFKPQITEKIKEFSK